MPSSGVLMGSCKVRVQTQPRRGPRLFVFSGCKWTCTGGGQRPVQLAREFARRGYSVVYAGSDDMDRGKSSGVTVLSRKSLRTNWELYTRGEPGVVVCTIAWFYPEVSELHRAGWRVVYDLVDDWGAMVATGYLAPDVIADEEKLVAKASLVTVSAPVLEGRARSLGAQEVALVRNGGPPARVPRPEREDGARVRVVYCGATDGPWIDWRLLHALAEDERLAVTIIGPPAPDKAHPALRWTLTQPHPAALSIMAQQDAAVIPFREAEVCRSVDPIKYYDHVACGLWTVATPEMADLAGRPYALIAEREGFADACVEAAGRRGETATEAEVAANCWAARTEEFERAMAALPTEVPGES